MAQSDMPRVARIASFLGKFAPSCAIAGFILIHLGMVPPEGGLMFFQIGLLCALFAVGFGIATVIATRHDTGGPARSAGWFAAASGMILLTATILGVADGSQYPPINDITTDLEDPPAFASAADVPDFAERDMSYPPAFVEIVRLHYSDLEPIRVPQPPAAAYAQAIATAQSLGWEIVHQAPEALTIDARETSTLFKYVDDIVVRVRPDATGSVIDLRSKSRVGKSDLGMNAKRIRAFREAVIS